MRIESYSFGTITIDGKEFTSDVIIYPDRIDSSWWRKEGHSLHVDDLRDVIEQKPDTIVIGTGFYDLMKVPQETRNALGEIQLHVISTQSAVDAYNLLTTQYSEKKVIAVLHLTC